MQQSEPWSWGKFFSGFFNGKNFAKAMVNLWCSLIILTICFSVYSVIKSHFAKVKPAVVQTEAYSANQGVINKTDSHDESSVQEIHHHYPLSDLFSFLNFKTTKTSGE